MKKTVTALVAATTVALAAVATPDTADARGGWWGPAIGGFAAGAIIGSAVARPYYGYPSGYYGYYAPTPVYYGYYAPAPAYYGYGAGPYRGCARFRYGYRHRVC
jgi:hypothetical protein